MRTIMIIAIAISVFIGIIGVVFVVGGIYQQELFDEYVEDMKNPSKRNAYPQTIPSFDMP